VKSIPKSHSSPLVTSSTLSPHMGGRVKEAVPDQDEDPEIDMVMVPVKDPVMDGVKELEPVPETVRVMDPVEV